MVLSFRRNCFYSGNGDSLDFNFPISFGAIPHGIATLSSTRIRMAGGAAAKARAAQMQGFRGGGSNPMQQMMMQGGPEVAELREAEAMAAAFHAVGP